MGDDTVRLADFGLARALEDDEHLTGMFSVVGTPEYMAPALLAGEKATKRSDVYAYGVMMFEACLAASPPGEKSPRRETPALSSISRRFNSSQTHSEGPCSSARDSIRRIATKTGRPFSPV
jgi:serine/threonine-protein kinase